MRHLFFTTAVAAIALSATIPIGTSPAKADGGRFCISGHEGGGIENCNFATLRSCKMTTSGNSGSCIPNPNYTGEDYAYGPGVAVEVPPADAYAYAPGPVYGPRYGYAYGPRYARPGFGVYINGY